MADNLMLRKESGWMVVFTCPDVCKTPPNIPVPYPVVAFLKDSAKVQDNVRANSHPFVLHDKSCVSRTIGDQLGILKGIKSQTVGGECYPLDKSNTFKVHGKWTVRVDDGFWMNGSDGKTGNTRGKVVKMPSLNEMLNTALDGLQLALDVVGLIPGLGEIADGLNCVICLARGDYAGAALSAAAMIPFAGWAATGAKVGRKVVKAADKVADAAKLAKKAKKAKNGASFKGKGKKPKKCKPCKKAAKKALKGKPVNPMQGCKILMGDMDTDFSLNSAFPLVWQRSYASNSEIGTVQNPYTWFGQGWDCPYAIQIKVLPAHDRIDVLLPFGRVIEFPFLEVEDSFYSIHEDFTLIREVENETNESKSYKFRIAIGTLESASTYYEFHHQVENLSKKPEHLLLCTGTYDLYGNRIGLEYLHKDEVRKNYPSHIVDSIGRVLAFDFIEVQDHIRLKQIKLLQGLGTRDPLDIAATAHAVSLQERLFQAEHEAHRNFENLEDVLNVKVLVRYEYSKDADLINVYIDDSPVEANEPSQYKLRLSRKYEWKNHILTAHHEIGGVSSFYEYNEYSPLGKVTRHWINTGEEFIFDYQVGFTNVISAPNTVIEKVEKFYYNDTFDLIQYVDPKGYSEYYTYNNSGQLLKKTDADGGITEYQYSGAELTKIRSLIDYHPVTKLPIWREISLSWTNGHLTQVTDPLGHNQTTAYDFAGQPLVVTDALGQKTQIKYTPTGMAYAVVDAKGGHKHMLWDRYANLQKYKDCSDKITQYDYDHYGRLIAVKNALGYETRFKYYARQEQPCEIIYPDQSIEHFKYDVLERLVEYRDALGRTTGYQYSHDSLPIRRIDPAHGVVTYHYDQLRRFVGLTNENGQMWTLEYDSNDQVIAETTFDNIRTEYEYSPAGKLVKHRQYTENKQVRYGTVFKRDMLGQLLEQYIVDHQDLTEKKRIRYDYDLAGQLLQARNMDSHVKLSYDEIGQLTKEQLIAHWYNEISQEHVQRSHNLTHLYDELGNRIETILPDGRKLKTMYYGSGHAWHYALQDSEGIHEISSLKRDNLHQESERTQGQLHTTFKLDPMGRLTEQQVAWENAPARKRLERLYDYDKAGQLKEILDKRYLYQTASQQNALAIGTTNSHGWQRKQIYQYDVLSRLTSSELITQGQSENFIQIRERFAFDPASNILPITSSGENNASISNHQIKDNRVKHLEQSHQTVDFEYDDLGRVIQKRIQMKDQQAFGYIQQHLSNNHVLHQLSTRQIDLDWDEQNQLKASTSIKPDGCGGQEIIQTQYCYDPFGRRIAKQSQIYKKALITHQVKLKTKAIENQDIQPNLESSNRLGSSINLSLGGRNSSQPSVLSRSITQPTSKTVQTEQLTLIQKQAVWNVWDGNRILQDYNGQHVFTTVYEADSFVPLARLVWLDDKLSEAANDDLLPHVDTEKINQLKHIALQNIGELEGLGSLQTIPEVANDEQRRHSAYQIYWYQNDHLGTPRELTTHSGDIAWEAVYQAWGNTVAVEWQAVEAQPIELNAIEKSYLLQPHRFQGQTYDIETGLHYNRFRYYDPDAGRFVSHDPIGLLGGENQFQYAPNPVEWVDPYGLAKCKLSKKDKNAMGPKPKDMADPHRHHIVRENAPCNWSDSNRRYILASQLMVQKYLKTNGKKFDINRDPRNFVWAENGCGVHTKDSAKMVYDHLSKARRKAMKQGTDIGNALEGALSDLGKIFNGMR
jgi:RHS repeat-associated protein